MCLQYGSSVDPSLTFKILANIFGPNHNGAWRLAFKTSCFLYCLLTCTSYPKALDCFSNLKTPPATKPTPVCLDASPLVMMQSTSDLSIHGIAPLAEEMGNVLRWLEISLRSRLAQTLLLATLQS